MDAINSPRQVSGIEIYDCPDDDVWHLLRANDVTASAAGALLGEHEFTTLFQLYQEKSGAAKPDDLSDNEAVMRGELFEEPAVKWLRRQKPGWTIKHNSGDARVYFRDPAARLGATPDILAHDPERGPGAIQVKSVAAVAYRRKWCADGAPTPPLWIAVQALVEASLTGAKWAAVAPFVVQDSGKISLELIDVPIVPGLMDRLREASLAFWDRIARKDPPPVDYARDGDMLAKLYGADDGSAIDLTGWNRGAELAALDAALAKTLKDAKDERDAIKAEFLEKVGKASVAMMDGRIFATAKTVSRKEYTVKASSYRQVSFK